jgi:hypothetical protein
VGAPSGWLRTCSLALVVAAGPWGDPARAETDRALIVVGLPGDSAHEALFRQTARRWREGLTGPLGFPADRVRVLFGAGGEDGGPATREAIAREVQEARTVLAAEGRLWVLVLGHANQDSGHAFLHLPGPDLRDDEFAALFQDLACREQVFWLTMSASGWFLPALSAKGRIVIAATARDQEFNETEFPHALADVIQQPPREVDQDGDGRVSVWELFLRTAEAVESRFASDRRAPTEHAQLDDDGDGVGTERPDGSSDESKDGSLAKKALLPARKGE